jgi:hypothetical protein
VEKLLTDPTAKGLRRANYTKLVKGQRVQKPESEWIWVPCPAGREAGRLRLRGLRVLCLCAMGEGGQGG